VYCGWSVYGVLTGARCVFVTVHIVQSHETTVTYRYVNALLPTN
jgi:hypothetical protein